MKGLLADALGVGKKEQNNREEFLDLFGIWTEEDGKQFFDAIKDLESVHAEDW